ncbi:MAG: type III secretion system chaperone [Pseudomonadota bacterium]
MADPIDAAIQETMRKLGIEDAALDEDGALTLDVEGAPLLLRRGGEPVEGLWIHIGLGDAPEGSVAARFLMRAAFEGWSQGRMTVGLDRRSGQAWAGSMLPAVGITADLLESALVSMIDACDPLRERLAAGEVHLADDDAAASQAPAAGAMRV